MLCALVQIIFCNAITWSMFCSFCRSSYIYNGRSDVVVADDENIKVLAFE